MDDLLAKLELLAKRYQDLENQLVRPELMADREKYAEIAQEATNLKPAARLHQEISHLENRLAQTQELLNAGQDPELVQLAQTEIEQIQAKLDQSYQNISQIINQIESPASVRPDPGNAILEVRGAAGGDEAKVWSADLLRMYLRYAESQNWQVQYLDDGTVKLIGKNAYSQLKNEAGVHRVQRVPVTEAQGRIHTSTATVAVLPEVKEAAVSISPNDLIMETFRSGGPGGQNVNKVNTAVRIKHLPSRISVVCSSERSQLQNRQLALQLLRAKLWQAAEENRQTQVDNLRKSAVGRGMRAEKIRTYNYPQNRVTDHRLDQSWHNLERIINGDLDPVIEALKKANL